MKGALPASETCYQRVGEEAARAAVEAADITEVPGLFEVAFDEPHVALVVELVPDGYRFWLRRSSTIDTVGTGALMTRLHGRWTPPSALRSGQPAAFTGLMAPDFAAVVVRQGASLLAADGKEGIDKHLPDKGPSRHRRF